MAADELRALARRARLISRSTTLCTTTALLVCAVIAVLFLGASLKLDAATSVALLFITAMAVFFLGLLMFLGEIFVAQRTSASVCNKSQPPNRSRAQVRLIHATNRESPNPSLGADGGTRSILETFADAQRPWIPVILITLYSSAIGAKPLR
jgi:hypothetical protein